MNLESFVLTDCFVFPSSSLSFISRLPSFKDCKGSGSGDYHTASRFTYLVQSGTGERILSCFSLSIGISFIYSVIELLFLFLFIHCKLCLSLLTSFFDLLTLPTVKVKELISQPIYLKNSENPSLRGAKP